MKVISQEGDLILIELDGGVVLGIHGHKNREGKGWVELQFVNAANLVAYNMLNKDSQVKFRTMLDINYIPTGIPDEN